MDETHTRKVDRVGRIVIPKEIREALDFSNYKLEMEMLPNNKGIKIFKGNQGAKGGKSLDDFGRIVVPSEYREELKWDESKEIRFKQADSFVVLNDDLAVCQICGSDQQLIEIETNYLCKTCLDSGIKQRNERLIAPIDKLINEYVNACNQSLSGNHVHEVKDLGDNVQTVLEYIYVAPSDNDLIEPVQKANKRLGKMATQAMLKEVFQTMTNQSEYNEQAEIYHQMKEFADKKIKKQHEKFEEKIPKLLNDDFLKEWKEFKQGTLASPLSSIDLTQALKEAEMIVQKSAANLEQIISDKSENSSATIDAQNQLLNAEKSFIFTYNYLAELNFDLKSYESKCKKYEKEIERLKKDMNEKVLHNELKKRQKNLNGKKKHIKAAKQKLSN
ncbi:AbrB/MazE/SpoVT family DNA-binding domain-containing protein [Salipaludibacillus daqingensis]|uniref:AbrB/MazE/SpoVT family DNA-binding domain-containing protein n=1 Tax=Salipaludibacillus daqingensis TaxID=3041001 RepID=UPI002473FADB|nr:AbrB/MazE/SpoVT family DNA-binding domain-containing protein [Salipaludibacillus daqingensis]